LEVLRALAAIRTPFWNTALGYLTYLGDETVFIAVGLVVLWCVDKKWGFRLFYLGLLGSALNQLLKAVFLLPRPWVRDPSFQIVESARAAATGYSFPSGHTQGAAMLLGGLALWIRKRWFTVAAAFLILLVAFSRMYLGVHTPLDVGVSLATGLLVLLLMRRAFVWADSGKRAAAVLGAAGLLVCAAVLAYLLLAPVTPNNVAEFDLQGRDSVFSLMGGMVGLILIWLLDDRVLRFPVRAVWWAQVLKVIGGLILLLWLRGALEAPLAALFGDESVAAGVHNLLLMLAGGALWPLTFPLFAKLGKPRAGTAPGK